MIQQLLGLLPRDIDAVALLIAVAGALLGGVLWLGGSRVSRTLMTLISVAVGAHDGLQAPRWLPVGLEGWATAVLGALLLGISGYALHKVWVGIGLGVVLAVWAAVATFTVCGDSTAFAWPATGQGTTVSTYLLDLWNALSPDARRLLPLACSAAMTSGIVASIVWQKLGLVLLYSTAGMTLLLGLGVAAINSAKREWLGLIPSQTSSQVIVLLSAVAFGAILQWRCAPGADVRTAPQPH
jgi:hypothetical protein